MVARKSAAATASVSAVNTRGDRRISVGYVRRAHGIRGSVVVRPLTDHPDRYRPGAVFLTDEDEPRLLVVGDAADHPDGVLVRFEGVADRSAAERLQGVTLTIGLDERRQLGEDEFWPEDLEGLTAIDPNGGHLGMVTGVVLGAAQDRIVITRKNGEVVEVPFVEAIVGEIHPSLAHIVIDAPEGLF